MFMALKCSLDYTNVCLKKKLTPLYLRTKHTKRIKYMKYTKSTNYMKVTKHTKHLKHTKYTKNTKLLKVTSNDIIDAGTSIKNNVYVRYFYSPTPDQLQCIKTN